MATDARNHTIPAASDVPSRNTLLTLMKTTRDLTPVTTTTTRGTVVTAMAAESLAVASTNPLMVYRADARPDSAIEVTIDGTTWRSVPLSSGLVTGWTPTVSAGLTVGNGTWAGEYEQRGAWVEAWFMFTMGSTSSVTGNIIITLPIPIATTYAALTNIGAASLADSSAGPSVGRVPGDVGVNATTSPGTLQVHAGVGTVNATTPFTWAVGDLFSCSLRYRAA